MRNTTNLSPLAGLLFSLYLMIGMCGFIIHTSCLPDPDPAIVEQIQKEQRWLDEPHPLPTWSEKKILQWQMWQYEKRWQREREQQKIRQLEWGDVSARKIQTSTKTIPPRN